MAVVRIDDILDEVKEAEKAAAADEAYSLPHAYLRLLRRYRDEEYADLWLSDSRLHRVFGGKLISIGRPVPGYGLAHDGHRRHTDDLQLRYLCGLALARIGELTGAGRFAGPLALSDNRDVRRDALSLLGRVGKDRYQRTHHVGQRLSFAKDSAEWYHKAYQLSFDIFPGINAATMFLLANRQENASELAADVVARAAQRSCGQRDYWVCATAGEANIVLGDLARAEACYSEAVGLARGRGGDLVSMRRNVLLLNERVEVSGGILKLFQVGSVLAFFGEQIDNPTERADGADLPSSFPADPAREKAVADAIRQQVHDIRPSVAYCSARCGSDILFAEVVLACGVELHVVLPCDVHDFVYSGVHYGVAAIKKEWLSRCETLLSRRGVTVHYATQENGLSDRALAQYLVLFLQGLAINHAESIGVEPVALVVEGIASARQSSLACRCFLDQWRGTRHQLRLISLVDLFGPSLAGTCHAGGQRLSAPAPDEQHQRQIKAMLFADVKGYSALPETITPLFVAKFLDEVRRAVEESERKPVFANTWGDGLYLVFDGVIECADFALRLQKRFAGTDWSGMGLPSDMSLRIGAHFGPVYRGIDPVIGRENFFGSHVTRAARIEPVALPGCVFVSEQFATALAVLGPHDFICVPAGKEDLAKGYDACVLFWLGRREGAT